MDRPSESNKNKAKNWLYRLFMIKNQNQDPERDAASTRSSFRRSLKKMQTRVKSCVFPQRKQPDEVPGVSSSSTLPEIPPALPERIIASANDSPVSSAPPTRNSSPRSQHRIPTDEILSLSMRYWYWGPMTTAEAEDKLKFKPDGTFLVRDSSSTSYLFSISFRSVGKTMHARIEYSRGKYNLYGTFNEGFSTVTDLIENAVKVSEDGVYCYSRRGDDCDFPVRLTKPISRYTEVRSLKYLCKFVIRQRTNINDIPKLPLPTVLYGYLLEGPYF